MVNCKSYDMSVDTEVKIEMINLFIFFRNQDLVMKNLLDQAVFQKEMIKPERRIPFLVWC